MDEKTCMLKKLSEDLTFTQGVYLIGAKLEEKGIVGKKYMQINFD